MMWAMTQIPIQSDTIDLDQLLKLAGVCGSGGEAKFLIQGGDVRVNGEVETRRRRTLRVGDKIEVDGADAMMIVQGEQ